MWCLRRAEVFAVLPPASATYTKQQRIGHSHRCEDEEPSIHAVHSTHAKYRAVGAAVASERVERLVLAPNARQ
jgi:hypothetical protein